MLPSLSHLGVVLRLRVAYPDLADCIIATPSPLRPYCGEDGFSLPLRSADSRVIWTLEYPGWFVTFEGAATSFATARHVKGGFVFEISV